MNGNIVMEKEVFIEYCSQQLKQVFNATKEGKPDLKLKHQSEGLLRAAELLDVISRTEASKLIEKEHLAVFGITSVERAERKRMLQELKESSPDDFFDIPAIERRK
jgi:hypothetical protein